MHCQRYDSQRQRYLENKNLSDMIAKIKAIGQSKEYDCAIGLSGGVDSSYVAYLAKKHGLRPLAIHVDAGWNSELAVQNIEHIVKKLGIDLDTFVCDWEEMRDLQLSFFKASVANCDIPQDHAFVAAVYKRAAQHGIKYILSGVNFATESVLPKSWGHSNMDLTYLKAIHKMFGSGRLKKYPMLGFLDYNFIFPYLKKMRSIRILDYINFNKAEAKQTLMQELGWRDYGGKHYESRFTRFFQSYYLPVKFGFDKRRAHLSSLILSGQMMRDDALSEIAQKSFDPREIQDDMKFISKKLNITLDEFKTLLDAPPATDTNFPSNKKWVQLKVKLLGEIP